MKFPIPQAGVTNWATDLQTTLRNLIRTVTLLAVCNILLAVAFILHVVVMHRG